MVCPGCRLVIEAVTVPPEPLVQAMLVKLPQDPVQTPIWNPAPPPEQLIPAMVMVTVHGKEQLDKVVACEAA